MTHQAAATRSWVLTIQTAPICAVCLSESPLLLLLDQTRKDVSVELVRTLRKADEGRSRSLPKQFFLSESLQECPFLVLNCPSKLGGTRLLKVSFLGQVVWVGLDQRRLPDSWLVALSLVLPALVSLLNRFELLSHLLLEEVMPLMPAPSHMLDLAINDLGVSRVVLIDSTFLPRHPLNDGVASFGNLHLHHHLPRSEATWLLPTWSFA